jgi:hypothetical protein
MERKRRVKLWDTKAESSRIARSKGKDYGTARDCCGYVLKKCYSEMDH